MQQIGKLGNIGAVAILNPESKWSGLGAAQQLAFSLAMHVLVLALLCWGLRASFQSSISNIRQSIDLELCPPGDIYAGQPAQISADLLSSAEKLPLLPPDDLSSISSGQAQTIPMASNARAAKLKSQISPHAKVQLHDLNAQSLKPTPLQATALSRKQLLRPSSPDKRSLQNARASSARLSSSSSASISASASPAATSKIPLVVSASPATGSRSQDRRKGPDAINLAVQEISRAVNRVMGKPSFEELDQKACATFMEGESCANSDPDKASSLWQKSIGIMNQAIPLLEAESGPESTTMAEALRNVGRCYDKLTNYERSSQLYMQSAQMLEKLLGPESIERAISLVYYGDAKLNSGNYAEAEAPLLESLPAYRSKYGEKSQYLCWTYQRLARICRQTNRADEAKKWQDKMQEAGGK